MKQKEILDCFKDDHNKSFYFKDVANFHISHEYQIIRITTYDNLKNLYPFTIVDGGKAIEKFLVQLANWLMNKIKILNLVSSVDLWDKHFFVYFNCIDKLDLRQKQFKGFVSCRIDYNQEAYKSQENYCELDTEQTKLFLNEYIDWINKLIVFFKESGQTSNEVVEQKEESFICDNTSVLGLVFNGNDYSPGVEVKVNGVSCVIPLSKHSILEFVIDYKNLFDWTDKLMKAVQLHLNPISKPVEEVKPNIVEVEKPFFLYVKDNSIVFGDEKARLLLARLLREVKYSIDGWSDKIRQHLSLLDCLIDKLLRVKISFNLYEFEEIFSYINGYLNKKTDIAIKLEIDDKKFNDFDNSSGYSVIKIDTEHYADMPDNLYYHGNKVFTDGYNEYAPNTIATMSYVAKELTRLIRELKPIGEQLNW